MLNNVTIKTKLIFITIISLIVLSGILGTVSIYKSKDALIEQSYATLTAARDNKALQLKKIL